MRLLALDLGASTGYAILDTHGMRFSSGTILLDEHDLGARLAHLTEAITGHCRSAKFDVIAFEDVPARVHPSGNASHVFGAYMGGVLLACNRTRTHYLGVKPAAWKKEAGLLAGTKAQDAYHAATTRWPDVGFTSPDEAVARFVALAAWRIVDARSRD